MRPRKELGLFRTEWKLMYQFGPLVALLALWGSVALATTQFWLDAPRAERAAGVLMVLEVGLPLLALFSFAHAASLEWEEGTVELVLSYPRGGRSLLGRRLLAGSVVFIGMAALALGAFCVLLPEMLQAGPANAFRLLGLAVPPALFVGAAGLLGGIIGRHYAAGVALGLLPWVLDLFVPGNVSRWLYLFQASRPLCASCGVRLGPNRALILLAASLLVGAAFFLWTRRERAVR